MYNKAYQIKYIARYVYFKKRLDFINLDIIEYDIVNSLKFVNSLLILIVNSIGLTLYSIYYFEY